MAEVSSIQISSAPVDPSAAPGGTAPSAADPSRPAWLPENFTKPEDLATSYKALQAELTTLKQGKAGVPAPAAANPAAPPPPVDPSAVPPPAPLAPIKMEELEAEYTRDGKLSDARYAQLAAMGFGKDYVDANIAHRTAAASAVVQETLTLAGGPEQFQSMAEWAKTSYTPEQLAAYNKAIDSGDKGQMQLAVKGLRADFERVKGVQPSLLKGVTSAPGAVGEVYQSMNQLMADQADPRYKADPAFRASVAAKLARSPSF